MEQDTEQEFDGPSKSQRKRDAHKLQELGTRLTLCSESQLHELQIPAKTITAIAEFNRLPNSHGARRRQLQFIGKLMRDLDYDQVSTALEKLERIKPHTPKPIPVAKSLAEKILEAGDIEINELIAANPNLERQKLRQFYREYQTADDAAKLRLQKKLQRYIEPFLTV